jgi:hypothetical protein
VQEKSGLPPRIFLRDTRSVLGPMSMNPGCSGLVFKNRPDTHYRSSSTGNGLLCSFSVFPCVAGTRIGGPFKSRSVPALALETNTAGPVIYNWDVITGCSYR